MLSVNKVILVGNVGQDPDIKHLDSGSTVANFSLATSKSWKKNGERITKTEWHRVVVWSPLAEKVVEPYVKKGTQLLIEGELETRSYEKDGIKRYTTEIRCYNLNLGSSKNDEGNSNTANQAPEKPTDTKTDDLPF